MAKSVVYCLELPTPGASRGVTYGCSRKLEDAVSALDRGRQRGVKWGEIVERKQPPRGVKVGEWLPPFDKRGN